MLTTDSVTAARDVAIQSAEIGHQLFSYCTAEMLAESRVKRVVASVARRAMKGAAVFQAASPLLTEELIGSVERAVASDPRLSRPKDGCPRTTFHGMAHYHLQAALMVLGNFLDDDIGPLIGSPWHVEKYAEREPVPSVVGGWGYEEFWRCWYEFAEECDSEQAVSFIPKANYIRAIRDDASYQATDIVLQVRLEAAAVCARLIGKSAEMPSDPPAVWSRSPPVRDESPRAWADYPLDTPQAILRRLEELWNLWPKLDEIEFYPCEGPVLEVYDAMAALGIRVPAPPLDQLKNCFAWLCDNGEPLRRKARQQFQEAIATAEKAIAEHFKGSGNSARANDNQGNVGDTSCLQFSLVRPWPPKWLAGQRVTARCFVIHGIKLALATYRNATGKSVSLMGDGIHRSNIAEASRREYEYVLGHLCWLDPWWVIPFPFQLAESISSRSEDAPPLVRLSRFAADWLGHLHADITRDLHQIPEGTVWRDSYILRWRDILRDVEKTGWLSRTQRFSDPRQLIDIVLASPIFELSEQTHTQLEVDYAGLVFGRGGQHCFRHFHGQPDEDASPFDAADPLHAFLVDNAVPMAEQRLPKGWDKAAESIPTTDDVAAHATEPTSEGDKGRHDSAPSLDPERFREMEPRLQVAYAQYLAVCIDAEEDIGKHKYDTAYEVLRTKPEVLDRLPPWCATDLPATWRELAPKSNWLRYVGDAGRFLGKPRKRPRAGRTGGSVRRISDIR